MLRVPLVALLLAATSASAQAVVLDRVVARVDGQPILRSQVQERLRPRLASSSAPAERARLAQAALDELVDEALVAQAAAAMKLSVGEEEVDRALAAIASANGLSAAQLEVELKKQGYTLAGYRRSVAQQLLAMRWLSARVPEPAPEGVSAGAWLDQQRARLVKGLRAEATLEVLP